MASVDIPVRQLLAWKGIAVGIRFVFGLHDHQPVGNFDGVFESAYRDSYAAFLDLIEGLVDEWLGLDVSLTLSKAGGFWAFPIQTVSQSEGGFELVHQSTAVLPHWQTKADSNGCWEVAIKLSLDVSRAEKCREGAVPAITI
jgi:hypothetical protein